MRSKYSNRSWLLGGLVAVVILLVVVFFVGRMGSGESSRSAPRALPADTEAREGVREETSAAKAAPPLEDVIGNVGVGPTQLLTMEEIHTLILRGSPELDEMDQETRLDAIKHMLRDAIERTMSLEVLDGEFHFAWDLWKAGEYEDALAVYLAIYDAASVPENMCRVLRDAFPTFDESWSGPHFAQDAFGDPVGVSHYMCFSALKIHETYLKLERNADAERWVSTVSSDVDELIAGVASGMDGFMLIAFETVFENMVYGTEPGPEKLHASLEYIEEYLLDYLKAEGLEQWDQWYSRFGLAVLYEGTGRADEALALFEELLEDGRACGYPVSSISRRISRLREETSEGTVRDAD